jgi:hypothetical protein
MNEACEMILAGAAFTTDQKRRRGGGDFLREFEKTL